MVYSIIFIYFPPLTLGHDVGPLCYVYCISQVGTLSGLLPLVLIFPNIAGVLQYSLRRPEIPTVHDRETITSPHMLLSLCF